jgi:hypothetical protein
MAYSGSTAGILSNYDEVLKTFYLPAVQEQLNNANILSKFIDTNEEDISGKDATIEMHYGRSAGLGARADGGALPEADYQKFKKATVPMKYNYGRVTFSGPTIAATRQEKGAYARVVETEITGIVRDMRKEINRQLWGTGYGVLARWRTGTTTSMTVQRKYRGNSAGGDGFGSTFGGKYLAEIAKCYVNVPTFSTNVAVSTTLDTTELTVSAITYGSDTNGYDTLTITDAGVSSEAAGTYYVRPASTRSDDGSQAAGYQRLEMMGIAGIVSDVDLDEIVFFDGSSGSGFTTNDPLQGLAVGTYGWWKSQVLTANGTKYGATQTLTLNLMQKMFDKVERKAGKDYGPDMILTTRAIRREYLDLMQADRRHVNTMELDGGFTAIDYNGVPFTVDDDAIDGCIYFLTLKDLQLYRMSDYDWMQKDGAILSRLTGYDAYEAVLFRYAELGCKRRNAQGVLMDITSDIDHD